MKLLICLAAFICLISTLHGNLLGRKQRVSAKGKLLCGVKPASNVTVKLVDEDDGKRYLLTLHEMTLYTVSSLKLTDSHLNFRWHR